MKLKRTVASEYNMKFSYTISLFAYLLGTSRFSSKIYMKIVVPNAES